MTIYFIQEFSKFNFMSREFTGENFNKASNFVNFNFQMPVTIFNLAFVDAWLAGLGLGQPPTAAASPGPGYQSTYLKLVVV